MVEEESLRVDAATLVIIEYKLLITKWMKKKRRQMITEHESYVKKEET